MISLESQEEMLLDEKKVSEPRGSKGGEMPYFKVPPWNQNDKRPKSVYEIEQCLSMLNPPLLVGVMVEDQSFGYPMIDFPAKTSGDEMHRVKLHLLSHGIVIQDY